MPGLPGIKQRSYNPSCYLLHSTAGEKVDFSASRRYLYIYFLLKAKVNKNKKQRFKKNKIAYLSSLIQCNKFV